MLILYSEIIPNTCLFIFFIEHLVFFLFAINIPDLLSFVDLLSVRGESLSSIVITMQY